MKALSILQPWASLVVLGHKKIETRSWNTKYRGPILIHASLGTSNLKLIDKKDPFGRLSTRLLELGLQFHDFPLGAIIGQAEIVDTAQFDVFTDISRGITQGTHRWELTDQEKDFGDYTADRWGWLLQNPIQFSRPIPCKGALNLWEFTGNLEAL